MQTNSQQASQAVVIEEAKPKLLTRPKILKDLIATTPVNTLGLPLYIYNPAFLPAGEVYQHLSQSERLRMIETAKIHLDYDEGFPKLKDGRALWFKFDFEPLEAYQAFESYLLQPEFEGLRQLDSLNSAAINFQSLLDEPQNSLDPQKGPPIVKQDMKTLQEYFFLYCWKARVKAYDLYEATATLKLNLKRLSKAKNSQFRRSEKVLQKLETYFDSITIGTNEEEDEIFVEPDAAVRMMKNLSHLSLEALEIPANCENLITSATSTEEAIEQVAKISGNLLVTEQQDSINLLLQDEQLAAEAQSLVLQLQQKQLTITQDPNPDGEHAKHGEHGEQTTPTTPTTPTTTPTPATPTPTPTT